MAERLQRTGQAAKAKKWKHDWHSYEDNKSVHHRHIERLVKEGKVLRDVLSFIETADGQKLVTVNIRGRIECAGDVLVFVDKWLDVRRGRKNRYEVKGYSYSYHAWLRNTSRTPLRYDTAHGFEGLHRHRFVPAEGREVAERISLDQLPTLTGFIEEALQIAAARSSRRS
jgi:hypothetical protein